MEYDLLNFDVPKKINSEEEHNRKYQSDCGAGGTYVPNMSEEDMKRWKCKHVKGDNERVELRKSFCPVNLVVIIYKNEEVKMSMNGKLEVSFDEFCEISEIAKEAKEYMLTYK